MSVSIVYVVAMIGTSCSCRILGGGARRAPARPLAMGHQNAQTDPRRLPACYYGLILRIDKVKASDVRKETEQTALTPATRSRMFYPAFQRDSEYQSNVSSPPRFPGEPRRIR